VAIIYIDAATHNQKGPTAISYVINNNNQKFIQSKYVGDQFDNHEGEWLALINALEYAELLSIESVIVYTDSKVVADSMEKDQLKHSKYEGFHLKAKLIAHRFELCLVNWSARKKNKEADLHAKQCLYEAMHSLSECNQNSSSSQDKLKD